MIRNLLLAGVALVGLSLASTAQAQVVNAQTGTTYTFTNRDCDMNGRVIVTFSNTSAIAATLPQAGASGLFHSGCKITVNNVGQGLLTITPTTSTINGQSTLVVSPGASVVITNDATSAATGNYLYFTAGASPVCATYYYTGTIAATNQSFFIAPRPMVVVSMQEVHSTAAGGTSTMDIKKDTGTSAPGTGTTLGQTTFNLNGTANTVQTVAPSATLATRTLAAGDRLSVVYNHTIQSSAGVTVEACMMPM